MPSGPGSRWAMDTINSTVGIAGREGSTAEYAAACSLSCAIIASGALSPSTPMYPDCGVP